MNRFRRIIPLSLALIASLLLLLIGCTRVSLPGVPTTTPEPAPIPSRVRQVGLKLSTEHEKSAVPGSPITFTHILTNTGDDIASFAITATALVTWPIDLWSNSYPTKSSPLSLTLGASATTTLYLSLTVPVNTSTMSGTSVFAILTATSRLSSNVFSTITDTVIVQASPGPVTHTQYSPPIPKDSGAQVVEFGSDFGPGLLLYETAVLTVDAALARDLGITWTRAWLPWAMIETAPGQYDWSKADQQINQLARAGYKIDSVIYHPPAWAAETGCGPISDTVVFEQFMTAVVTRYGELVDAWEFINEPDSPQGYPKYGPAIGCWALQPQTYVDQLALFHTQVKALDPTAMVVLGGLAYDNWQVFDRDFLTHTLQSGAGPYFDVVSLHFYPINPQDFPTMAHKISEIKTTLQRHGVYHKLIWVTETSMWTNGPDGTTGQRNFIVKEQTRGFCAGADKIFWFALREELKPPPLKRWLINRRHQFDQGYATYQNYARQVEGTFCRGAYSQVPVNVEAYELDAPDRQVYILWTTRGTANVTMPAGSSAALIDRDGQTSRPLTASAGSVSFTVGPRPIFVVVTH